MWRDSQNPMFTNIFVFINATIIPAIDVPWHDVSVFFSKYFNWIIIYKVTKHLLFPYFIKFFRFHFWDFTFEFSHLRFHISHFTFCLNILHHIFPSHFCIAFLHRVFASPFCIAFLHHVFASCFCIMFLHHVFASCFYIAFLHHSFASHQVNMVDVVLN